MRSRTLLDLKESLSKHRMNLTFVGLCVTLQLYYWNESPRIGFGHSVLGSMIIGMGELLVAFVAFTFCEVLLSALVSGIKSETHDRRSMLLGALLGSMWIHNQLVLNKDQQLRKVARCVERREWQSQTLERPDDLASWCAENGSGEG